MEIPNGYVEAKLGDVIPRRGELVLRYPNSNWNRHVTDDGFVVAEPYGIDDTHVIAVLATNKREEW